MKKLIKFFGFAVTCAFAMMLLVAPVSAKCTTPKSVNITVGSMYTTDIKVVYTKTEHEITDLKTNSSNLYAAQTRQYWYKNGLAGSEYKYGYGAIGLYAKKAGTYQVTFKVNKTKYTVKVIASNAYNGTGISPIKKSATFAGKDIYSYDILSQGKTGVFKVYPNTGFKVKSIKMTSYNKDGETVTKDIKNGANVTISPYAYFNDYDYSYDSDYSPENNYWSYYMYTNLCATTSFDVVLANKKTGEEYNFYYTLRVYPKN